MKNIFTLFLGFILLLGANLTSCTTDKDNYELQPDSLKKSKIKGYALTTMEQLGKSIYFDKISSPNNMACADCHAVISGFTGPVVGFNIHGSVYRGADAQNFGNRKPPSAAYATFSPVFHYDNFEGVFIGGNFWDGRATGERLGSPTAEQALGPFLNSAEHNLSSKLDVIMKIAQANYAAMWTTAFGEPIKYSTTEEIDLNYDRVGLAIAAFEGSPEVNQFSSKFDYVNKGLAKFTPEEEWGFQLFNNEEKGKCSLCHISGGDMPLFTDFTFDNVGTPKNLENPVYKYDPGFIDKGLGGYLLTRTDALKDLAYDNMGKHKVPTLRNVDKKPGLGFTKAYMHNGVFKSLKEVVHFYNTRDVEVWPAPEVEENINDDELGDLGLSDAEEDAIVAFMKTLSDGYIIKP
ncbi:MAG TPA: cytochrome c peroxidase [Flavobacterium sp.]|nr:cytochrome c peroxidase [Flavobacterium sp.]